MERGDGDGGKEVVNRKRCSKGDVLLQALRISGLGHCYLWVGFWVGSCHPPKNRLLEVEGKEDQECLVSRNTI